MKKRLLITSIVMMLVVAVALSTATYAWFTTNTTVIANPVVLTASTMSGAAVLITHEADGTGAQQSITLTVHELAGETPTALKLYPATPKSATAFDTFTTSDIANIGANFQNLIMTGTGKYSEPTVESPNVSFYKDTFYVFNKGYAPVTLTPKVTIHYNTADNTSAMAAQSARIAIIERVPSAEVALGNAITANMTTYELKNIWQYSASNSIYEAVGDATFSATQTYYTNTGTEQTPEYTAKPASGEGAVTSSNYDELKSTLFIKTASVAASGATGTYGATVNAQSGYVPGSVTFTANNFTAIDSATSGMHVANEYTVVVWLEGWDADCTNAITAGSFSVDLSFEAA